MFYLFKSNVEVYYKNLTKESKLDKKLLYGINPKYKKKEYPTVNMVLLLFYSYKIYLLFQLNWS